MLRNLKKGITDQNTKYHSTTVHIHGLLACWLPRAVLVLTSHGRHGRVGKDLDKDSKDTQVRNVDWLNTWNKWLGHGWRMTEASKIIVVERVDTDSPFTVSAKDKAKRKKHWLKVEEPSSKRTKWGISYRTGSRFLKLLAKGCFGCESLNGSKRISDKPTEEKFMDSCKIYGKHSSPGNLGAEITGDWDSM